MDFGLLTFILLRDEVQSVLSTPRKPFFYMLCTQFLSAGWSLTKCRFWPKFPYHFMYENSILQNRTSFVASFPDQFTSSMIMVIISKAKENHLTWKIYWIYFQTLFVTKNCILKSQRPVAVKENIYKRAASRCPRRGIPVMFLQILHRKIEKYLKYTGKSFFTSAV